MFQNIGDLAELMRNAGKIRESIGKTIESLGQLQVEGSAGGGLVTAKVNGRLEVVKVTIDPKLLADQDVELLEDLVAAALNQALEKAREESARSFQSAAGGLPIGDISRFLGGSHGGA